MIKRVMCVAATLVSMAALAGAGGPSTLVLETSISPTSEVGQLVQLSSPREPGCRYSGTLKHKALPQNSTTREVMARLTGDIGDWWVDVDKVTCAMEAPKAVRLRVPLNPIGIYSTGTKVPVQELR